MFVSNSRRAGDSYDSWEPSGIWPEKLCVETAEMEQRCATSMCPGCINANISYCHTEVRETCTVCVLAQCREAIICAKWPRCLQFSASPFQSSLELHMETVGRSTDLQFRDVIRLVSCIASLLISVAGQGA